MPYHSARIEMCRAAMDDLTGAGGDYRRMLENIWSTVDASKIEKVDVSFKFRRATILFWVGLRISSFRLLELTATLCLAWREMG